MQAITDFLPVVAFFVAYKLWDVYVATAVLIGATGVQVLIQWLRHRTVSRMALYSAALVLLFGGVTLYFHNELVLMWMPTVLYLTLAAAFLISGLRGPSIVEQLLGKELKADARTWRLANWQWIVFWVVLALVNLAFVYRLGLDAWAHWKLAKVGVIFAFALGQGVWLTGRAEHVGGAS
ncbi:MAG: septation protein IspZ [Proteobacteria bacterium]|nr:septation protein IspZ [Pseudomonadota bacterium]